MTEIDNIIIEIHRNSSTDEGTTGNLTSNIGFSCATLERPSTGDHPRINCGQYICSKRYSPHRGYDVYGVNNVLNRSDIEFHIANFFYELLGCIALGAKIEQMQNKFGAMMTGVSESKSTFEEFMKVLNGRNFTLIIHDNI